MNDKITLSFYSLGEKGGLTQLRSSHAEYPSIHAARAAAVEALEKYPQIDHASIVSQSPMGSPKIIERVERGPVF